MRSVINIVGKRPRGKGWEFRPCIHKPTHQEYAVAPCDGTIETAHGTMSFRRGDAVLVGVDGETMYALQPHSFVAAYDVPLVTKSPSGIARVMAFLRK